MRTAIDSIRLFSGFARGSLKLILQGNRAYWMWLAFLGAADRLRRAGLLARRCASGWA